MTRIAVLSDIHGNLVALDACLADLGGQGGADEIVAAGDLCVDGPKPKKVLQRLEEIGARCVRGNTDRYLYEEGGDQRLLRQGCRADRLDARETRRALVSWLRELPFALRIGDEDNQLLIVHANPVNDDEHLWPDAEHEAPERV